LKEGVLSWAGVCGGCEHACGRALAACTRVVQMQSTRVEREVP